MRIAVTQKMRRRTGEWGYSNSYYITRQANKLAKRKHETRGKMRTKLVRKMSGA